jgi:acyl-CoA synthetase (AMP-forming)/AMP-acid ligase II/3-oxoacyl-(acyl-carrier-protein) synthase/acyl carrier protein
MTEGIHLVVRGHAARTPDKAAIVFLGNGDHETERLTYAELTRRADVFAGFLHAQRLAGERVLLPLPGGPEHAVALLGCLHAGCVPVTVEPPLASAQLERIAQVAQDCDARGLVHESSPTRRERFAALLEGRPHCRAFTVAQALEAAGTGPLQEPAGEQAPDAPALLQYTSGSTGRPRGVVVTHANLLAHARQVEAAWRAGADDLFVNWLPVFHDFGLVGGLMQPLYLGATVVMLPTLAVLQRPWRWLRAIARFRARVSLAPPFGYELCVAAPRVAAEQALDLSCWELAAIGAEPVHATTLQRFAERFADHGFRPESFRPGYGMAETALSISLSPRGQVPVQRAVDAEALLRGRFEPAHGGDSPARVLVGNGHAWLGAAVCAVDPVTARPCEPGQVGELWLRGPGIAAGYWNRPEETARVFKAMTADGRGPFLRSGDLGVVVDGEVYVTGRLKDLVIVRGRKHSPADLEASALEAHASIERGRAAAFSVEGGGQEEVVIVAELRRGAPSADLAGLVAAVCERVLADHGLHLQAVVVVRAGAIPFTSSGKVRRAACRQAYLDGTLATVHSWRRGMPDDGDPPLPKAVRPDAPDARDEAALVQQLREAVARRRGVEAASLPLDAPFASLGLDSMEVVALSGELSAQLDMAIEPTLVFDHPSLRALARHLARKPGGTRHAVKPEASRDPAALRRPADAPVALIGMACRFPGAATVEAFRRLLEEGRDVVKEVPAERWCTEDWYTAGEPRPGRMNTCRGGFIDEVDGFDAAFFGISGREARSLDPQQRLLLMVAWEALEDAGLPHEQIAGGEAGVFVGIGGADYLQAHARQGGEIDAWIGTGTACSVAANRLSYFLDLRGPSVAIDTACSSALAALHEARKSLLAGECDLALVGSVNLMLAPETTVALSQARMLSPEGRCKSFDAEADGYVRGEGCGVVVLKRLADAERDDDRVHAVVAGSAINHVGRSNGLSAPTGPAQAAVMRKALAAAGLGASDVGCVEAHGTGTPLGDAIELNAIRSVYGAGDAPLRVASVKTNVGHLEAASGMAGLIKTVLQLKHGVVYPHLHLRTLHPLIDLAGSRVRVPRTLEPWPVQAGRRHAAVHAFGIGGTNAHAVLTQAAVVGEVQLPSGPQVLTLSARSATALRALAQRFATLLAGPEAPAWAAACFTSNVRRSHLPHRLALLAEQGQQAADALMRFAAGERPPGLWAGEVQDLGPAASPASDVASLAQDHVRGVAVDWLAHWRRACKGGPLPRPVALPPMVFEPRRYWFSRGPGPESLTDVATPRADAPLEGTRAAGAGLPAAPVKAELLERLFGLVARIVRLDEGQQKAARPGFGDRPLNQLGIDSLMAVELRHAIRTELAADVPLQALLDTTTAQGVVDVVYQHRLLSSLVGEPGEVPLDDAEEFVL